MAVLAFVFVSCVVLAALCGAALLVNFTWRTIKRSKKLCDRCERGW